MNANSAEKSAAVLISGSGSNLQSLMDSVGQGHASLSIDVVVSNNPHAYGLKRARDAGIATACLNHKDFADRSQFELALADVLIDYAPDYILLAGFMRILTAEFVDRFAGKIVNIHPSLLPKYPGLNTHQQVLDANDAEHGCTVHFVTAELDAGPSIIQGRLKIDASDTAESLAKRVLKIEHQIYPRAAALLASGRLRFSNGKVWLDDSVLKEPITI